ncbi:MAG: ATP-dependent zinc metalloprotease FtsH [bacterium]
MSDNVKRIVFIAIVLVTTLFIYQYINQVSAVHSPTWTEFKNQVEANNVQSIKYISSPEGQLTKLNGEYRTPVKDSAKEQFHKFELVPLQLGESSGQVTDRLQEQGVEIETKIEEESMWTMLLVNSLPILLIIGIWLYFIYRTRKSIGGGMMGVGESRAQLYQEEKPDVTFDSVAGYSGPKNEVSQVIEFLKNPEKFSKLGGEIPRGVLMVGPPGTGKTLMARAVAGEAGVPFLSTEGSDFMEMFVGVGASRVRDLFERAKELAPSIIFIDEIDSVGRKRGAGVGGGHDEREQTLNQLLSEMDGFEANTGVILVAATNRPDILDPALLRPGRFDRQVTFDLPTKSERLNILNLHAENKPLTEEVDLEQIASGTPGFSGADLKNLLNEAALIAAEKDMKKIPVEIVEEARDKVLMGLRREEMAISEKEKETMATHESGHTLVAYFSDTSAPVHKVTIIPRGRALGATQQLPIEEKKMYTREDLMSRMAVLMGGRAAEVKRLDTVTNGAQDDLRRATKMARKMVLQWGMSSELGNLSYHDENGNVFLGEEMGHRREYSEKTAEKIDRAVHSIIEEAMEKAKNVLDKHNDKLELLIKILTDKETLNSNQIKSLMENGELPPETEKKEKTEEDKNSSDQETTEEDNEENQKQETQSSDSDEEK